MKIRYTAQVSDLNLAWPEGTAVKYFASQAEVKAAWSAGYWNTIYCSDYWGGDLPAMSDSFTVTVWRGELADVTDVYPDAEVVLGRRGNPVWRPIH